MYNTMLIRQGYTLDIHNELANMYHFGESLFDFNALAIGNHFIFVLTGKRKDTIYIVYKKVSFSEYIVIYNCLHDKNDTPIQDYDSYIIDNTITSNFLCLILENKYNSGK